MTTHEVAKWFDGLKDWLGDALDKNVAKNLAEVAEAFRQIPEKPFKEFVKDVKLCRTAASAETNGAATDDAAKLIDEMRAFRNGQGGSAKAIEAKINRLKKPGLDQILGAFDLPSTGTVPKKKKILQDFIASAGEFHSNTNGAPVAECADVEQGYREYCRLRDALSSLTIPELRSRFAIFHRFSKPVLEAIAQRLGYSFKGKDEVISQLLQTLEGMKISHFRGEVIGSM